MNHDDNKPDLHPLIDPALEARVVAWVAGEASPFEVAELTRLIGEKPELGIFKRRIEVVHGLAAEAVRHDKAPLRLAAERRAKLLQAIGASDDKSTSAAGQKIVPTFSTTKKAHRKDRQWLLTLAACLTVGLFTVFTFPIFKHSYGRQFKLSLPESAYKAKLPEPVMVEMPSLDEADSRDKQVSASPAQTIKRQVSGDRYLALKTGEAAKKMKTSTDHTVAQYGTIRFDPGLFASSAASVPLVSQNAYVDGAQSSARIAAGAKGTVSDSAGNLLSKIGRTSVPSDVNDSFQPPSHYAYYSGSADKKESKGKLWGSSAPALPAPTTPQRAELNYASPEGEKIILSPFEVKSFDEGGYVAAGTLAGTRIHTELKDIASSLTVVTPQFLKETGATDASTFDHYSNLGSTGAGANPARDAVASRNASTPEPVNLPEKTNPTFNFSIGTEKSSIIAYYETGNTPVGPAQAAGVANNKPDVGRLDDDLPLAPPPAAKLSIASDSIEVNASKEPVSTFSLHVSDVSFRLAQAALANNEAIDPARIRPEEFYNAFSYGDPTPTVADKVSCRVEQAAHPFLQQRNLVRIALKVAASGRDAAQPLHLTILLDTSGSMEREDRSAVVHRAMETLVSLLGPNDRITLIGFARQPSLLAESLPGDQSKQILDIIAHVPAEGGTNLEEALKLGAELARRQFEPTAQNRIVLLTDGAANLGNANPTQLAASIEVLRQQGIAFDACGVGLEGLDDAMLENLTRKGDGRYYVLNSPEAADASFAHQLAGAFRPAAENVKLQVRFNPARVGNYRLIGFEQHRLREEDFRNDNVDAAELAAEEAAVAVYQVEALPQGEGELGEVYVRFRDAASGNMVERSWTLSYDPQSPAFDRATPSMQLAGTAALLAEKLRGGQNGDAIKLSELAPIVNKLRSHYANESRVQELATMFEQMRRQAGE